MMSPQPIDGDLLVSRFLDDELSTDEIRLLEQWLRQDPSHFDTMVRRVIDHQRLHELTRLNSIASIALDLDNQSSTISPVLLELLEYERQQTDLKLADITDQVKAQGSQSQHDKKGGLHLEAQGKHSTRLVIVVPKALVWGGVAAAILLLASVIWQVTSPTDSRPPGPIAGTEDPPTPPSTVATVVDTLDAAWNGGRTVRPGMKVSNQPLELASGLVVLEMANGVLLTVEAPARVVPESEMLVALDYGKLVGLVPEQAHGFTVRTKQMDIVDLGTEFAIETTQEGSAEVHVLSGEVLLESDFDPITVTSGDAYEVEVGQSPVAIDAQPGRFYRRVPAPYERLIRNSKPLGYWRFDSVSSDGELEGLGFFDSPLLGLRESDLSTSVPAVSNDDDRSLQLKTARRMFRVEDRVAFNLTNNLTVHAWIWVPNDCSERMRIVANSHLLDDGRRAGYGFGVSGNPIDSGRGTVLMFTSYSMFDAYSLDPIPTEQWVHVAATFNQAGTLKLYVDGVEQQHRVRHASKNALDKKMIILSSLGELTVADAKHGGDEKFPEYWTGGIDELAIYGRVLSSDELSAQATFTTENQ